MAVADGRIYLAFGVRSGFIRRATFGGNDYDSRARIEFESAAAGREISFTQIKVIQLIQARF